MTQRFQVSQLSLPSFHAANLNNHHRIVVRSVLGTNLTTDVSCYACCLYFHRRIHNTCRDVCGKQTCQALLSELAICDRQVRRNATCKPFKPVLAAMKCMGPESKHRSVGANSWAEDR